MNPGLFGDVRGFPASAAQHQRPQSAKQRTQVPSGVTATLPTAHSPLPHDGGGGGGTVGYVQGSRNDGGAGVFPPGSAAGGGVGVTQRFSGAGGLTAAELDEREAFGDLGGGAGPVESLEETSQDAVLWEALARDGGNKGPGGGPGGGGEGPGGGGNKFLSAYRERQAEISREEGAGRRTTAAQTPGAIPGALPPCQV